MSPMQLDGIGTDRDLLFPSVEISARTVPEVFVPQSAVVLAEVVELIEGHFARFDADDRFLQCNQRYREFIGDASELATKGVPYRRILKACVDRGLFPEAVGNERRFIDERMAQRAGRAVPYVVRVRAGSWFRIREQRLSDGSTVEIGVEVPDRGSGGFPNRAKDADLNRRVERRIAELLAANRELEAFSYSIAHDLKAPLRAIGGFAEMLRDEDLPVLNETARQHVDRILANTSRMNEMIEDLLRLSQVTRNSLTRTPLDLAPLARAAAAELFAAYPRARLQIAAMPPAEADRGLMLQVYSNLIANALKFSRKREHPVIEVGAERLDNATVYFVRDNGAGFSMHEADRLFGVFQRLHPTREFEGTGVGLAIVQRIVQRHGGRIWAHSAPNAGATFHFTLEPEEA